MEKRPTQELLENVTRTKRREGKVTGVFATTAINRGARLVAEQALLSFADGDLSERSLTMAFANLSAEHQVQFLRLRTNGRQGEEMSEIMKIFESNFMRFEDGSKHLFLKVAQMEHQCAPSAIAEWNHYIGRMTVHLLRSVEEDEEITISFVSTLASFQERWLALRADFGINCMCVMCQPASDFGNKMRINMNRVLEIEELMERYDVDPDAWRAKYGMPDPLDLAKEYIGLLKNPISVVPLGSIYRKAAEYSLQRGNIESALRWVDEEISNSRMCYGRDSARTFDAIEFKSCIGDPEYLDDEQYFMV